MAIVVVASLAIYFTFPRKEKAFEVFIPEKTLTEEKITPPEGIVWNLCQGPIFR